MNFEIGKFVGVAGVWFLVFFLIAGAVDGSGGAGRLVTNEDIYRRLLSIIYLVVGCGGACLIVLVAIAAHLGRPQ